MGGCLPDDTTPGRGMQAPYARSGRNTWVGRWQSHTRCDFGEARRLRPVMHPLIHSCKRKEKPPAHMSINNSRRIRAFLKRVSHLLAPLSCREGEPSHRKDRVIPFFHQCGRIPHGARSPREGIKGHTKASHLNADSEFSPAIRKIQLPRDGG